LKKFEKDYKKELGKLKELFSKGEIEDKIDRLNKIYNLCEKKWEDNLKRFDKDNKIKYLLIAEAPPWSEDGKDIRYFYNMDECDKSSRTHLLYASWNVLITEKYHKGEYPKGEGRGEDILNALAKKGFLLIDVLPFAMEYKKREDKYKELVKACKDLFLDKIKNISDLNLWAKDVKVALSWEKPSMAVIKAFPEGLKISSHKIILTKDMILSHGKQSLDKNKLKKLWLD
jgi:hypothetical protein